MSENNSILNSDSFDELKTFAKQGAVLLPEDKRDIILNVITQIEASDGIQNETQAQTLLSQLMKGLGL